MLYPQITFVMNNILTRTPFEEKHFAHDTVVVRWEKKVNPLQFPGLGLDDDKVIQLSGAPTDSLVKVHFKPNWTSEEIGDEDVPPGILLQVQNSHYISSSNEIVLFRDGVGDRYGLYLKLIDLKPGGPKGFAARMLAIMVRQMLNLQKFTRMRLYAAGGRTFPITNPSTDRRWGGYVAWPNYGFDMPILPETTEMFEHFLYCPPNLSSSSKVSEVLELELGKEFWKVVGDGSYMDFDLSISGSHSLSTLDAFLGRVGI